MSRAPKWLKREIWRECGGFCAYCGCLMTERRGRHADPPPRNYFTVDHRLALGLGGTDDRANLVGACYACNQRKSQQEGRQAFYERVNRNG